MRKTHDYHKFLLKGLKNPVEAAEYLNTVLEEGDKEMFLVALRNVAKAQGGLMKLSQTAHMTRTHLYTLFSKKGNPEVRTLRQILNALGLRLAVTPKSLRRAA